ncbi:carbon storage regulator CsrA [Methylophaga thalassica]|nr:carbon storage regulator CsrA [Methylophaga thalassica]
MLILTRNTNESLMINDDVKVTVLAVNDYQVKFGIDAPDNISVHREEVYKRIQEEGKNN